MTYYLFRIRFTVEIVSLFYLFLYLDEYVLGDDNSIMKGSFMRTKHLLARFTPEMRLRLFPSNISTEATASHTTSGN